MAGTSGECPFQTQAVQEFSARIQNFEDKFDYLLERISALQAALAADKRSVNPKTGRFTSGLPTAQQSGAVQQPLDIVLLLITKV